MMRKGIISLYSFVILLFIITCPFQGLLFSDNVEGQLANSPWPCLGGNNKHSGNSNYDSSSVIGEITWQFTFGDSAARGPAIGADGTIFLGSEDNHLYAIKPDGSLNWKYDTGAYVYSCPAIDTSGNIYFTSSNHKLYSMTSGGNLRWTFNIDNFSDDITFWPETSDPIIGPDGTIYVGSTDHHLYAITSSGNEKWNYNSNGDIDESPAIDNNGTIYFSVYGYDEQGLYAINNDGTFKWKFIPDKSLGTPTIGPDGTIYVGSYDKNFYALNQNGNQKWSFTADGELGLQPAIGSNGLIYITSGYGNLYALNPNGSLNWSYLTEIRDSPGAPVISNDGNIYVHLSTNLYAFSLVGEELWNLTFMSGTSGAQPAIGSDGTIYLGGWDDPVGNDSYSSSVNWRMGLYALGDTAATTPSAPLTVQATPSDSSVSLSWTPPSNNGGRDVYGYKIYRQTAGGTETLLGEVLESIIYEDTTVTNGIIFLYRITALTAAGEGDFSDQVSANPTLPVIEPDTDNDGVPDSDDTDDDNDEVLDVSDDFPLDSTESLDTDADGIGNNADLDDDGDGVIDEEDGDPLDSSVGAIDDIDETGNNTQDDSTPGFELITFFVATIVAFTWVTFSKKRKK